ncbi:MAG: hypothetical protein V9G29_06645 [Burkholderiaceae bacterium]|jgi:hypothetical protein|nr:hypothetical protein [Patescibacteria group bacterium]
MKNIVIVLTIILGFVLSNQAVSANHHGQDSQKMMMPKIGKEFLVKYGYITESVSMKDYRMAIMRFQLENGLRET